MYILLSAEVQDKAIEWFKFEKTSWWILADSHYFEEIDIFLIHYQMLKT